MSDGPGRLRFTRTLGTERLIRAAQNMGLCTDGEKIWAKGEVGDIYDIDPFLLDKLAQVYEVDGHDVRDSKDCLYDEDLAGSRLDSGTVTLEEYQSLAAEGREPRVRFSTPLFDPDDIDDMAEFDDADIANYPDLLIGFDGVERSFGDMEGLDADPEWGNRLPGNHLATKSDAPSADEIATYEVVSR